MKFHQATALVLGGLVLTGGALAQPVAAPQTAEQKFSYAIAIEVARRFADQGLELDVDMALQGFRDGMQGRSQLTEEELRKLRTGLQSQTRQRAALDRRIAPLRTLRNGEAFLLANSVVDGVQSLPGGIQYKVNVRGSGTPAPAGAEFEARFDGRLLDGKPIGGTGAQGAMKVSLDGLVPGLREVLRVMPEGARWTVWIPSELGYGAAGNGALVPPHEVLVFEVERPRGVQQ